jgi:hypothetical protein
LAKKNAGVPPDDPGVDMVLLMARIRQWYREPTPFRYSDDMDQWLVRTGYGDYGAQEMRLINERHEAQKVLKAELWALGPAALPHARKALRSMGAWREILLKYLARFGGNEDDRAVLRLIVRRRTDPLKNAARAQLERWGENTANLKPKPRTTPTPSELAKEERLALLVRLCRTPCKVRDMMKALSLHTRRNFNYNYLHTLAYQRKYIESCGTSGPLRDAYVATPAGLRWLSEHTT